MKIRATVIASVIAAGILIPASARADEAPLQVKAPPASSATESAPTDTPLVHLSADSSRATIERQATTTGPSISLFDTGALGFGTWQHVCASPCASRLDARYAYRVAGDGLVPSGTFTLPRGQDRVQVDAHMGSSIGRGLGMVGTVAGVLAIAAGGVAIGATPILEHEDVGSEGFRTGMLVGGVGVLSLGVLSAAAGLYLWLSNGSAAHAEGEASRQAAR